MFTKLRITNLDRFSVGMADIQIERNPLRQEVILIMNDVYRDQYQDVVSQETGRYKKWSMVNKSVDLSYVQELDVVLGEEDGLPWVFTVTITGLPRVPHAEDQVIFDGVKYTISCVKPMNRQLPSVVLLFVYPERSTDDELKIYSATKQNGFNGAQYIDLIWGGAPVEYSFDNKNWHAFQSRIPIEDPPKFIMIRDKNGYKYKYDL